MPDAANERERDLGRKNVRDVGMIKRRMSDEGRWPALRLSQTTEPTGFRHRIRAISFGLYMHGGHRRMATRVARKVIA